MSPEKETSRLEALSDGVFAIAITFLSMDLKLAPEVVGATNKSLWIRITEAWPSFLTFILSFGSLLIMWVHHHRIFELIYKTNRRVLFANGFLLLLVVTVPFITSLLAEYFVSPAANTAMAIYSGSLLVINFSYVILIYTISSDRSLIKQDVSQYVVLRMQRLLLFGVPGYIVAFIVSFFHEGISLAILMLLWIYWAGFAFVPRQANHKPLNEQ